MNAPEHSTGRWLLELSTLLLLPIALMIAGGVLGASPEAGTRPIAPVEIAVYAVVAAQVVLGFVLIWRHRLRLTATVALVAGFSLWCVVAGFIAIMAITDNWL